MRTLKSSREIDRVFRSGSRAGGRLLTLLSVESPEMVGGAGRIAVVAGKKVGGAAARNRAKRVLREAVRRANGPWGKHDVVLIAGPAIGVAQAEEIDAALSCALERVGLS